MATATSSLPQTLGSEIGQGDRITPAVGSHIGPLPATGASFSSITTAERSSASNQPIRIAQLDYLREIAVLRRHAETAEARESLLRSELNRAVHDCESLKESHRSSLTELESLKSQIIAATAASKRDAIEIASLKLERDRLTQENSSQVVALQQEVTKERERLSEALERYMKRARVEESGKRELETQLLDAKAKLAEEAENWGKQVQALRAELRTAREGKTLAERGRETAEQRLEEERNRIEKERQEMDSRVNAIVEEEVKVRHGHIQAELERAQRRVSTLQQQLSNAESAFQAELTTLETNLDKERKHYLEETKKMRESLAQANADVAKEKAGNVQWIRERAATMAEVRFIDYILY